ncbi:MAG TPA: DUF5123 domain-containing protein [Paludibacter sp.]|nr:DUF5123 domain-containing protein [Paludibacter sp.]
MKKIIKNIFYILCFTTMLFSTACSDIFNEVTDLKTDRLFRPISFEYALNKTQVTLTWVAVTGAESYTLQISDDADFNNLVVNDTLTKTTFTKELAGSTNYFARIKANGTQVPGSEYTKVLEFKTPSENIFEGYSSLMTALNTVSVSWLPAANATHLVLTAADESTSTINLSTADVAAGKVILPALANSAYKIQIYNGAFLRGTVNVLVEGDVYLAAGQDLPTAIAAATAGQVIVLEPGALYLMGSATYRFDKNIKVRGLLPTNLPVLAMTPGTPTATSSMLGFTDGSAIDYVKFQNIDFTGYCNNDPAAIKVGYLFNNNLLTNVNTLSFDNCKLHNLGNTPLRVQGGKNQVIENVQFKNCTIWDIGFSSTYAIVNSNSADFINNISFDGCTIYNFKGSLVLRTGQTLKAISVKNCTINQGMQDASSSRYLIDANTATFETGITIDKCVFGSSGGALGANGVRNTTGTLTVTGSYFATDYVDDPVTVVTSYSIKKYMTAYPGASTALWNDPINGNFTLKATSFAGKGTAGDLRWY